MFTPRYERPEAGNKYYITVGNGGYSYAIEGYPTDPYCNVLSNCVGYAYGRFNEIGGYGSCKYLTPCNAENFIQHCGDLKYGQQPRVGACMVWQKGSTLEPEDGVGHVAIVEKVVSSTKVVSSESGWGYTNPFVIENREKGQDGRWGMGASYTFLGFIYNPACSNETVVEDNIVVKFLKCAERNVNKTIQWVQSRVMINKSDSWSCAFIVAIHKTADKSLSNFLSSKLNIHDFVDECINKYNCILYSNDSKTSPSPGDVAMIRNKIKVRDSDLDCDSLAIVTEVNSSCVTVIQGDVEGKSKKLSYSKNVNKMAESGMIISYLRPKWSEITGDVSAVPNYKISDVYNGINDGQSAIVRRVGYLNTQYEPSISKSTRLLSIINYTPLIQSIYGVQEILSNTKLSKLSNSVRTALVIFRSKGLSMSACIGITSCILACSDLDTNFKLKLGRGICCWTKSRLSDMIDMCGDNWSTDLSAQLNYIWYELSYVYVDTLQDIADVSDDESGAITACDMFQSGMSIVTSRDMHNICRSMWKVVNE